MQTAEWHRVSEWTNHRPASNILKNNQAKFKKGVLSVIEWSFLSSFNSFIGSIHARDSMLTYVASTWTSERGFTIRFWSLFKFIWRIVNPIWRLVKEIFNYSTGLEDFTHLGAYWYHVYVIIRHAMAALELDNFEQCLHGYAMFRVKTLRLRLPFYGSLRRDARCTRFLTAQRWLLRTFLRVACDAKSVFPCVELRSWNLLKSITDTRRYHTWCGRCVTILDWVYSKEITSKSWMLYNRIFSGHKCFAWCWQWWYEIAMLVCAT